MELDLPVSTPASTIIVMFYSLCCFYLFATIGKVAALQKNMPHTFECIRKCGLISYKLYVQKI